MLFIVNEDKPGRIGLVGSILFLPALPLVWSSPGSALAALSAFLREFPEAGRCSPPPQHIVTLAWDMPPEMPAPPAADWA